MDGPQDLSAEATQVSQASSPTQSLHGYLAPLSLESPVGCFLSALGTALGLFPLSLCLPPSLFYLQATLSLAALSEGWGGLFRPASCTPTLVCQQILGAEHTGRG